MICSVHLELMADTWTSVVSPLSHAYWWIVRMLRPLNCPCDKSMKDRNVMWTSVWEMVTNTYIFTFNNSEWFCDIRAHSHNPLPPSTSHPPSHPFSFTLSSLSSAIFHNALQILHSIHLCDDKALRKSNSTKLFSELTLHRQTVALTLTLSHTLTHTPHHLHKLVREQITCILSVIPRTLPAALHRSPFEEQPCDFSLFCPAGPFAFCEGFWSWILKLCMAAACAYQRVHKRHANQTRITHRIGGLHSKASLIANWVSRCETHTANAKQECGCFKASGWTN